jgi:hypothetical protein
MASVVSGALKNIYAFDCYQNGLQFRSSIMSVENLKLGPCGAVGMELTPEDSDKAGVGCNQAQTITFLGKFDVIGNKHTLATTYLSEYTLMGYDIPTVLYMLLAPFNDTQKSHMIDAAGEPCLVSFIMRGSVANSSIPVYPVPEGGIIMASDLPTDGIDTTHQFIRLPISLGADFGFILLYNLNYGK